MQALDGTAHFLQHGTKDQAPLAKAKTKAKSRTSSGKSTGSKSAGKGASKSAAKGARGKGGAAKKSSGAKNSKSAKGNKQSLRALAKATVKAKPPKASVAKSAVKPVAKPKPAESKWLKTILNSLSEMKAEDTVVIDLSDKSSIGETMVVTTGRSNVHLASIADRVVKDLKASGMTGIAVEGMRQGDWVVIDTGSVLVHVFRPEVRDFYSLEKMWTA